MEKFNFVRNGMIRLPPGFRFQPTDEEIVFQYLNRKVLSYPLPASIIPEINICRHDPWDLPGGLKQEKYFFSNIQAKYPNGNRINRTTVSGYWKATGTDKQIASSSRNQAVGMRKTLVFYKGKPPKGSKTDWVMHEYRLVNLGTVACDFPETRKLFQDSINHMESWVLCRVFVRTRSTLRTDHSEVIQTQKDGNISNVVVTQPRFIDFMRRDRIPVDSVSSSSSSSSSSDITEVTSSGEDHEESCSRNYF